VCGNVRAAVLDSSCVADAVVPPAGRRLTSRAAQHQAAAWVSQFMLKERDGTRPKVSLCMIVKNEEANLAGCLSPCAGLVDDIVIVDTGSTDRTKEVAVEFGARSVSRPDI